jgi:hypothetical protein
MWTTATVACHTYQYALQTEKQRMPIPSSMEPKVLAIINALDQPILAVSSSAIICVTA